MGQTGRRPGQSNGLRRPQANYYERRSGRRAAQEPPVTETFGARGANHETTNLGPDKTAWLGGIATKTRSVMELAAGPDLVDQKMSLLRAALSAPSASHEKIPCARDIVDEYLDSVNARLDAALDKALDPQAGLRAILQAAQGRSVEGGGVESGFTAEDIAALTELVAQKERLDAAGEPIAGPGFPPDIASLLQEDDRHIEYDQRDLAPPTPYVLPPEGPPTPTEITEQVLDHEQRQQGEQ